MPRTPKSAEVSDRAARVARMQREAKAQERRRTSMIWGGLALVLALVAGLVVWAVLDARANRPDMSTVEVYENLGRDHVTTPVEYEQSPPVGGDHHAAWWTCGIYDTELPNHHVVHSLEHGAVWLTYQPGIAEDELEALRDLAGQDYLILSPYAQQDSPIVATAWGHQLSVDDTEDNRLEQFVRDFRQGPQTPEPGAACTGGTTTDLLGG